MLLPHPIQGIGATAGEFRKLKGYFDAMDAFRQGGSAIGLSVIGVKELSPMTSRR